MVPLLCLFDFDANLDKNSELYASWDKNLPYLPETVYCTYYQDNKGW